MSSPFDLDFDFAPLEPRAVPRDPAVAGALAAAELGSAVAEARSEGFAAGREEALAALAPAAAAFDAALAESRVAAEHAADELEARAVDLAFALAEKIVGAAVEAAPSAVLEAVRGALRGIVERERVTLLVNPDDLELVRGAEAELRAQLGGIEHCEVQAERRVGRGGVIVRYAEGQVDARVETKLERAREVVASALT